MTNTYIAGFITPSKKELRDWVKRKRSAGILFIHFLTLLHKVARNTENIGVS